MDTISIRFITDIPDELILKIDQLLEENERYNRVGDNSSLPEDVQDCLYNKQDRAGCVLAFDGEILVGCIIIFKRIIQYNGEDLVLGGIGGVCTKKEYRRKGIGTNMLTVAKKTLEDLGCTVAFLRTDTENASLTKLYSAIGFSVLGRFDTYIGGKSGKRYEDIGGMIAPIQSIEKYTQILQDRKLFDVGIGTW